MEGGERIHRINLEALEHRVEHKTREKQEAEHHIRVSGEVDLPYRTGSKGLSSYANEGRGEARSGNPSPGSSAPSGSGGATSTFSTSPLPWMQGTLAPGRSREEGKPHGHHTDHHEEKRIERFKPYYERVRHRVD